MPWRRSTTLSDRSKNILDSGFSEVVRLCGFNKDLKHEETLLQNEVLRFEWGREEFVRVLAKLCSYEDDRGTFQTNNGVLDILIGGGVHAVSAAYRPDEEGGVALVQNDLHLVKLLLDKGWRIKTHPHKLYAPFETCKACPKAVTCGAFADRLT